MLLVFLFLSIPALGSSQLFLTTQTPSENGAYSPCTASSRGVHAQRGAGVTSSVTNSSSGGTDIATTDTGGGNEKCFVSDPLLADATISGTVTFNIWGSESAAQCNCAFRVKVYEYDGASETLIADGSMASELTTSNAANNWTATPTSTLVEAGHRLVIRTRLTNIGSMGNGRTVTMNYAGTSAAASGDSYVQFTENLSFTRTRTVKSSGGDYASLSACETGERGDLTTLTEVRQCELYSIHDTTAAAFSSANWTTSSTYYVRIYTDSSARHAGVLDTGKYYLDVAAGAALSITTNFAKVEGIQCQITASASTGHHCIILSGTTAGATFYISDNIFKGIFSGTVNSSFGLVTSTVTSGTATVYAWNNVVYGFVNGTNDLNGFRSNTTGWTQNLYNNTVYNSRIGYNVVAAMVVAKNNAAMSCNDGFAGGFDATSDFNASDIAADAPGANSQNGSAATFVDAANGNFKPASSDTVLLGNGTDDPGSGLFSDDIAGTSRTSPWDIGALVAQTASSSRRRVQVIQ